MSCDMWGSNMEYILHVRCICSIKVFLDPHHASKASESMLELTNQHTSHQAIVSVTIKSHWRHKPSKTQP